MKFTKMHGLGNSYIYINMFNEDLPENKLSETAVQLADKNTGIGSDGMILIYPSHTAAVKMRVFNNDGSEAKNCGNGLRCVAKYSYEHGLVTTTSFTIETLGGNVEATVSVDHENCVQSITINMGQPRLVAKDIPMQHKQSEAMVINEAISVNHQDILVTAISMGNPHAVQFIDSIEKAPVEEIGPLLEKHERFPEWVNVEWVEVVSPKEIHFRVWERGSGITQACGTGACAAVVASVLNGYLEKESEVTVHLLGGDLQITWKENGDVWMKGPAEYICSGDVYV
ncbi:MULTISPECIES: diaminopimelate epimerase [Shouchella]|uniref:Diaminopimelate epimerase n=3 Tax=Bacillaceae TaxID=186817 RepID=A0A060LW71_9BACI|nr:MULTISPECIES: diaminopimelate epimerase [Bacillaceae]AIC95496.1 diaminopimelate epimerase [Shouchella lehensis G1]KQL55637.1 diaminopimelate epimerase [Alkalicoccobacillus plakortidis]MBG9783785.1 diaminopimelate epimerase [Shouchella lehensis]TES51256.1 diaminopimelate epimerase [Shouchella lehensis]